MRRALLLLGVYSAATAAWSEPAYKGMSYTSFGNTVLSGAGSDQSLFNMSLLGTDTVALNFWWYQDTVTSTNIYSDPNRSATVASVEHAIDYIHGLGMKVLLKPMLDVQDGTWRANIEPTDPDLWFQNYTNFIGTFADMAEAKDVELFSIGCELNRMEMVENNQRWTDTIADVRSRYTGPITYSANWNEGGIGGGYESLPWWNQLDTIGIDAYFPVTGVSNPSLIQMQNGWTQIANTIENWRATHSLTDKRVLFTEVGLSSYDGSNMTPFDSVTLHPGAAADEQEQSDGYQALLSVMTQRDWWDGAFWWNWETNANPTSTTSFTPQHKLAEDVLANYYGGVVPPLPVSQWTNNAGGSFGTGTNWNNNTVPNNVYVAEFDRGSAVVYTVTLNTTTRTVQRLRVGANTVTFQSSNATVRNVTADDLHLDETNRGVIIGVDSGDTAVVSLASTVGTFSTRAATLGHAAGSSGTLNLTSSANIFNVTGVVLGPAELIVGRAGTGTLNITNGARVALTAIGGNAVVGQETGSNGVVNVTGANSLWSIKGFAQIGQSGQASLTVSNGGSVSALQMAVGPLGEVHGDGTIINSNGSLQNDGLFSPGTSIGTLHLTGNYTQSPMGRLFIELGSTASYDRLEITGTATLAGTLDVSLVGGYPPAPGDSFGFLFAAGGFGGVFDTTHLPDLPDGLAWQLNPGDTTLFLNVVNALAGDFNGDGSVDLADYVAWRSGLGTTYTQSDYDVWAAHFGESSGGGSVGGSRSQVAVPEPATLLLCWLVAAFSTVGRRR